MARPYVEIGTLNTTAVPGTHWHTVDGVQMAFAPDQQLPLALDESREYRIKFDGHTWTLYGRSGQNHD